MITTPTDEEFSTYVYKYPEITHSGIACNVNYLDPRFGSDGNKMLKAIQTLEQYASISITAYRAIEWWAAMPIGPMQFVVGVFEDTIPLTILRRVTKPTSYYKMVSEKVDIVE